MQIHTNILPIGRENGREDGINEIIQYKAPPKYMLFSGKNGQEFFFIHLTYGNICTKKIKWRTVPTTLHLNEKSSHAKINKSRSGRCLRKSV